MQYKVTVSVVSHSQGALVEQALASLRRFTDCKEFEFIVTKNVPEKKVEQPPDLRIIELDNLRPRGFAQNHNRAFEISRGEYFCILNPDVVFQQDVFGPLLEVLTVKPRSVVAPVVRDRAGRIQDSFRRDITLLTLIKRRLFGWQDFDYSRVVSSCECIEPDLIAGMFLLMRRDIYSELGGLDERYWLYFEDADFGRRCRQLGISLSVHTAVEIIHEAQRAGRRNFWYFSWHCRSMVRYLLGI